MTGESDLAMFVRGLPKAELHLHIEGTLEPEMLFELAGRYGVELPFTDEAAVRAAYSFTDLQSFLVNRGGISGGSVYWFPTDARSGCRAA